MSHTGSLAGTDQAFQAMFDQLGMIRVESPVEMMETLKFLSVSGAPKGRKLAAFSCSGGDAALVADACEKIGLELSQPSAAIGDKLAELVTGYRHRFQSAGLHHTAVGQHRSDAGVFQTMISDDYDAAVVIQDFPPPHIHADNTFYRNDAKSFIKACSALAIPGAVCSDLSENIDRETREILIAGGVTPLQGVDTGLQAIANACRYGTIRDRILAHNKPLEFEMFKSPDGESPARVVDEWEGKQRLVDAGIEVPAGQLININASDAELDGLEYPVVLKAVSADLPHKSEAGAVRTNLQDSRQLRDAMGAMLKSINQVQPDLEIGQLLVESMIEDVIAELMIGINTDPQFGQLLVIASGGVLVELMRDSQTLLLPADKERIRAALEELKCFKLLQGFRGKAGIDIDVVVESICTLARFAETHQDSLLEMDINPLMVTSERCVAADIMIREIVR